MITQPTGLCFIFKIFYMKGNLAEEQFDVPMEEVQVTERVRPTVVRRRRELRHVKLPSEIEEEQELGLSKKQLRENAVRAREDLRAIGREGQRNRAHGTGSRGGGHAPMR